MIEININPNRILASRLLSTDTANYQLYQITPITFGIYDRIRNRVVFAFASQPLAECLLETGVTKILEVSFCNNEDIASEQPVARKVLTLAYNNERHIVLDSFDNLWIKNFYATGKKDDEKLWSPHKIWGCGPFLHFDSMLITDRLVQVIQTICDEGQQLQLCHILWKDFEAQISPRELSGRIIINGEFTAFSVTKFKRAFFVFDLTTEEVPGDQEADELDDENPVF